MFRTYIRFKSSAAPSNADDTESLVCAVAYDLLSLSCWKNFDPTLRGRSPPHALPGCTHPYP